MPSIPAIDLTPSLKNMRVIITTRWGKGAYRPLVMRNIESYYVDTAMDNDSDPWSLSIGDPTGEYFELLERDNEVRVELFGAGSGAGDNGYIVTGMADSVNWGDDGVMAVTGRDLSALATDSTILPQRFQNRHSWSIIEEQARQLGFHRFSLQRGGSTIRKVSMTDGSESFWEYWYRLVRRDKMWLWTSPEGILVSAVLNWDQEPTYFFGEAKPGQKNVIPVENFDFVKTTAGRVGLVRAYGHNGLQQLHYAYNDQDNLDWIKRPNRVLWDTDAKTTDQLEKLVWDEIFESKVGAIEIKLTVADPSFPIRQNKMATVHLPDIGLDGMFFIVGVRMQASSSGFVQEVRMRERQYALTRRVPKDIQPTFLQAPSSTLTQAALPGALAEGAFPKIPGVDIHKEWAIFFQQAAKKYQGVWDFDFFLAVLLAICDQETSFHNWRGLGGPGGADKVNWYSYGSLLGAQADGVPAESRETYERKFANTPGKYTPNTYAVGPMQLYTEAYKWWADDFVKKGSRDEYEGGRWNVEANIDTGARVLIDKLEHGPDGVNHNTGKQADMWYGVSYYGHHYAGEGPRTVPTKYAESVKKKVLYHPGYLKLVQDSIAVAREKAATTRDDAGTDPYPHWPGHEIPKGFPSQNDVDNWWSNYGKSIDATDPANQMTAIAFAAIWAYYHKYKGGASQVAYGHTRSTAEFKPPPNLPSEMDCSFYAHWCYLSARAPDPIGGSYNVIGWTGSLWDHGKEIQKSQLRRGDLVFWGNPQHEDGHVTVYVGDGVIMSQGHRGGDDPSRHPMNEYNHPGGYTGSRTYYPGLAAKVVSPSVDKKVVYIQAGHDASGHPHQPYGHGPETPPGDQSGANGEVEFNMVVRDKVIALLAADNRFDAISATSWTPSAGAKADPDDDINIKGDAFISVHANLDTSGFFYGWPRDRGEGPANRGKSLADAVTARMTFSGHAPYNSGLNQSNERLWGYYAWGSPERKFPDNVDHSSAVSARILMEAGHLTSDGITDPVYTDRYALALYRGICDYFSITPAS